MIPINTKLGDLRILDVFIEYDGPQLFSCANQDNKYFIAMHAPETSTDNWLFAPITERRLRDLKRGRVSLREAFLKSHFKTIDIVSYMDGNEDIATVETVPISEINSEWLPAEGEYLEDPSFEVEPLKSTSALLGEDFALVRSAYAVDITPYESELPEFILEAAPMWDLSQRALDYIKSVRTPVSNAATASGRFVFDIALRTGVNRTDIPVKVLASLLNTTQKLIDSLAQNFASHSSPRAKSPRILEETRLSAVAAFPSSFGLRIETNQANLFANPILAKSLQKLVYVLSSQKSKDRTELLIDGLSPANILHFRAFARVLAKSGSGFSLDLGMPGSEEIDSVSLTHEQVRSLVRVLDAEVSTIEQHIDFEGNLIGFSLRTKFFMLENDEKTVSGKVSDDCLSSVVGKTVGQRYKSKLLRTLEIDETTSNETEKYTLISISSLEDK